MGINREQIQSIARIYDVLLDGSNWTDVLDELANQSGCVGVSILISDFFLQELSAIRLSSSLLPHVNSYLENNFDEPEYRFTQDFAKLAKQQGFCEIPKLVQQTNTELGTAHDLSEVEEWSRNTFGVYHRFTSPLGFEPAYFDMATFQYGPSSKESLHQNLEIASLYLPHLKKVNELSRPFNLLKARFKAVLDVLDRFHLGVFILAADGSVVIHNKAADRILELQDGIHNNPDKKLCINDPQEHLSFNSVFDKAISLAKGDDTDKTERIAITRPSGKTAFIAEISAVRSRDLAIDGIFIGAIIIVIDPDHHLVIDTTGLEMLFNLTPAEQQVCRLLIEGYATREIAECRDSSPETVRNQVRALLNKTKTRNRVDLVRLALSINLPVDSEAV